MVVRVGALLVLATLLLPGCLSVNEDALVVHVPPLRFGERWSYEFRDMRENWSVDPQPVDVPDRFGLPTKALVFRYPGSGLIGQAAELGTGNFLWRSLAYTPSITSCQGSAEYSETPDGTPIMLSDKLRYDWGELYGQTLRRGDHFHFERDYVLSDDWGGPSAEFHQERDLRVRGRSFANVTIDGLARQLPVLDVDENLTTVYQFENRGEPNVEETYSVLSFANGYNQPVKIQRGRSVETHDLVHYVAGDGDVVLSGTLATHQFDARHPTAAFQPLRLAPRWGATDDEFPYEDAIRAIQNSPESASASTWLATHPSARLQLARYWREPESHRFEWSLRFDDAGAGTMTATAVREDGSDSASSSAFPFVTPASNGAYPSPDAVGADDALRVARAFQESLSDWRFMSWEDYGQASMTPIFGFATKTLDTDEAGTHVEVFGPGRAVQALTGALSQRDVVSVRCDGVDRFQ